MKRIVILHGTSGVSLSRCAEKVKAALSKFVTLEHDDLEERIKREHSFRRMTEAVWQAPRDVVTSFIWPKAARDSISHLLASQAELGLLTCHLTYYRGQTHEFYEPGDLFQIYEDEWSKLSNTNNPPPPLLVITLIDDVYDVFLRLSRRDEVFDIRRAISNEYRRKKKEDQPTERDSQYVLAFAQVTTVMLRILDWRSREISAGDSLATRALGRAFVLAIKHPVQTATDLILSETGFSSKQFFPCYLSHPISRPRREQKDKKKNKTGEWPDFVRQFHNFVIISTDTELDTKRILLFMPTAIDELRIANREDENFPTLHRRWPLISEDPDTLLYESHKDHGTYDDFEKSVLLESIFNPVGSARESNLDGGEGLTRFAPDVSAVATRLSPAAKLEVNGLLINLINQMRAQIALRDHTLVRQCGRFLLYRPLFGEAVISGGVGAELKNWEGIARHSLELRRAQSPIPWPWGPAVFVHNQQDLPELDIEKIIVNVADRLKVNFRHFNLTVEGNDFEEWLRQAPPVPDDLLGGGPSPEEIRTFEQSAKSFYDEERSTAEHDVKTGGRGPRELRFAIVCNDLETMSVEDLKQMLTTQVFPRLIDFESQLD